MAPMGCNWSHRNNLRTKEEKDQQQERTRRRMRHKPLKNTDGHEICPPTTLRPQPHHPHHHPSAAAAAAAEQSRQNDVSTRRKMSELSDSKEPLKFGSITEVWKDRQQWERFTLFLSTMSEGTDSDGREMSLDRYATFLELYSRLDQAERIEGRPEPELKQIVTFIREHQEDFFGHERSLRCIDNGMRRQVLDNFRKVKYGEVKAGTWVYQPVYPRVLDKLNELVGSFAATSARAGSSASFTASKGGGGSKQ